MSELLRRMLGLYGYMEENKGDGSDAGGGSADNDGEANAEDKGGDSGEGKEKKPSDEVAKLLKEVMTRKNANEKLKKQLEEQGSVLQQIEALGGLNALKEMADERKATETKKLEEKGEWDRLKAQMNEEHGKVLSQVQTQLEELRGENTQLKGKISDLTVGSSFMTSAFIKEDLVIPAAKVRSLYGSHFDFVDGKPVAFDKPAGAVERTMLVDAKGDPLDFESAIKKIVDADPDRDQLLKSKIKQGSGSSTNNKAKTPPENVEAPHGSIRIAAALAKGALTK